MRQVTTALDADIEIDPTLASIVREELARVPADRRADAIAAVRRHLGSGFVATHAQHVAKWREVIQPFQQSAAASVRAPATSEPSSSSPRPRREPRSAPVSPVAPAT